MKHDFSVCFLLHQIYFIKYYQVIRKSIKDKKVSLNDSCFTLGRTNLLRNVLDAAAITCPSPAAIPFKNCIFLAYIHCFFCVFSPLENDIDVCAFY